MFEAVKRFFGVGGSTPRIDNEPQSQPQQSININNQVLPFREHFPPNIDQIESEIAEVHKFMEQQMRTMMGSFGFTFGSPFSGFGFGDDSFGQFRSIPFTPEVPSLPQEPFVTEPVPPVLDPRDEVLKPQFRSKTATQWNGQDQILDDRLNNEGLGSVIDELRPPNTVHENNNHLLGNFQQFFGSNPFASGFFSGLPGVPIPGPETGSVMSSSTVTIYSNVNGHKSVEKIVRHPDGKIERTVITGDENGGQ